MPLDAEPPNNRSVQRDENLDVVRTSVKKTHSPKALRVNLPVIRTYLLCAPSRHGLLGSRGTVGLIALMAANTFRSPKRPTLLKRSTLQNQSAFLWLPISPFIGRVRSLLMIMTALALRKFVRG